ncbi:hypothetical protein FOXB_00233 [Fusarium oxysporum f. sp. conglutinans Fo5176]|uniref:Uncharacterized protein n=1 Tax=Fusarium oxysporum (strain Fo5176) TaxID=660025 RepID=F9F1E7_FUSOF|nr:hypothetical protein FOXB_00233 [Fusarium oxysporum f. sp. conglutinans Fo5176]
MAVRESIEIQPCWPHVEYVTAFGFNDESGGLYRDLEQNLEAFLHEDAFWWPQVKILQPSLTRTGGRNCLILSI